ncbi:fibronectin type III domain-containing protein [Actinoplanes oblitus]|uniref:Fibronectin type III domain-containing protein n=1 Tax=Actinoplanes oblitus TaxID=3040509 RepID=A0ABY8WFB1_9ACTN|nr:fibronectin type III domain-containing protein [Actinoplanes oblitus]WIM95763.1 fibronectin type III domain-containing protein [Actinoplanes oblitus]
MAITWGSYDGHLRLGIDLTTSTPSTSSTSVTVTCKLYIQCSDDFDFDDDQTWTLSGNGGGSGSFHNSLANGASKLLETVTVSAAVDYDGTGTMTYSARLSGAFNGASPTHSRTITLPKRPPSVPAAPSVPTAGSITATSVNLTWSAGATNGAALDRNAGQVSRNSGFTDVIASWDVEGWAGRTVTGLPKGTVLYARVRAHNRVGWSSWSGTRTFTTAITTPSGPGLPGISDVGPTSANVTWNAPSDTGGAAITNYEIQRATDAGFTTNVASVTDPSSPGALTGLLPGTIYYVRTRAINAAGSGAWSTTATFTTLSGVKVGDGTTWRDAIVWVGNGSSWVLALVKVGNGTAWK